jgi:hypothetical protein
MSNELINVSEMGVSKYADDKAFESMSSVSFLPRVQLMGSGSNAVKEGKINQGHYALVTGKDKLDDLTKELPVLVLAWRPKAMEIGAENVISIYNPASAEFKRIAEKSEEPDSGCMYGPEFLLWVPSSRTFATFFMSSKTARREAPQLKGLMGKSALLKSQLIKAKKFAWHGPVVTPCSQPFDMPGMDEVKDQVQKFNNPPENETEKAPEAGDRDR